MSLNPLPYSLLALAIIAASLPAQAETYQVSTGPKTWSDTTVADGLTITGDLETPASAITLKPGTHVQGDLSLSANIHATGTEASQTRYARPVSVSGTLDNSTTVAGSMRNKGNLTAEGASAVGLLIENAVIEGGIDNDGLIALHNGSFLPIVHQPIDREIPAGLSLNETKLGAGLNNNGRIEVASTDLANGIRLSGTDLRGNTLANAESATIRVSGDEATGIAVDFGSGVGGVVNAGTIEVTGTPSAGESNNLSETAGITINSAEVDGDLSNRGNIQVSGHDASGISISGHGGNTRAARITGDLINTGSIEVTAVDEDESKAAGVVLSESTINGELSNSGLISANGTRSTGIQVEGGRISGNISNSGTIKGGHTGIYLSENNLPGHTHYNIIYQNDGLIEGGEYAIYSDTPNIGSRLILSGGTVKGNIHGVSLIDVVGDATFDGSHIESLVQKSINYGGVDIFNADDSPLGRPGKLTLLQPHVVLEGHLEMNRGTVLQLNLSDATDPGKAILQVRNEAYFSEQSTVALRPTSEAFRASGKEYKLIQAREIEYDGSDGLVVSSSPLLTIDSSRITDTEVLATVSSVSGQQAGHLIDDAGGSSNAGNAFDPFYADVMGTLNDDESLFQTFANADQQYLAALSEQLAPQLNDAQKTVAHLAHTLVDEAVGSRTSALRGASSGSAFNERGFWVQGHDSDMRQGRRSGVAGYDADSQGLSLGLDGKLSEQWTLGMAYSNLETKVSGRNGNKTDIDSQILTLYSGFEQGNAFVDANLSYGLHDNTSKRDIAGTRAKGDFDSQSLALNLEAGYGLHSGNLILEPRVAARYSQLDIDGYREKGSSAALRVSGQRYEVIELGAGARLAGNFELGQGRLEPELKLMAYHDFAADQASSTSSFVLGGSSFVTHGARPARDSYEASLGLSYNIGALSLGASYDHTGRSGFDADTLRANVRYAF